ncbi:MAG: hypothetical protein WC734_04575 [Patescibacteria group bacterium]
MPKIVVDPIVTLTTYELVIGVLSRLPRRRFTEGRYFQFFLSLLEDRPEVVQYLPTTSPTRGMKLKSLYRVLSIMEIGQFVACYPEVYEIRLSMATATRADELRTILEARHGALFDALAREFITVRTRGTTAVVPGR